MLLRGGADLHDPVTFQAYFEALYGKLTDLDPHGIQGLRRELRFESVNDAFRMIDDDTVPVIVSAFDAEKVEPILDAFRRGAATTTDFRALQPFIVQVRREKVDAYRKEGWMLPVADEASGFWSWYGHYDTRFGLEPRADDQAYVL